MAGMVDTEVRRLVVTGPARDQLFEHFSRLFYGHDDVVVIKDRRRGERRRVEAPVARERRSGDRRRRPPDWVVPPEPVDLVSLPAAACRPGWPFAYTLTSVRPEHRRGGC